ncbi:hypothetical protein J5218_001772 [Escherichia coli]|nr:hypothetical protein [Escherichia coli]ELW6147923.1 hypothetical protein [Escherichia coli]EMD6773882.1 hypothetical protein [Escherichia coli]
MKTVNELIKDINSLTSHLHEKDFLLTWEQTPDELKQVLDVAAALKALRAENISTKVFNSGLGISVFRDNSTRTRFSYASALNLLGLAQQDLDEGKSQIAHGETVRETANMISFCADAIGIRDDMYLGAGNAYMREVGAALDDGYKQGVLPQRPALVNLQCDIDHPTQSMADLAWLREHFGSLENLTRDGEALYMHCLPADISGVSCKEGEVTEGVFEKYRIATYKEASWKPYIIAAMILSRKYAKPGALLEQLLKEAQERVK